jgi:hypothetical protein
MCTLLLLTLICCNNKPKTETPLIGDIIEHSENSTLDESIQSAGEFLDEAQKLSNEALEDAQEEFDAVLEEAQKELEKYK